LKWVSRKAILPGENELKGKSAQPERAVENFGKNPEHGKKSKKSGGGNPVWSGAEGVFCCVC
jgi:hypothetical protein